MGLCSNSHDRTEVTIQRSAALVKTRSKIAVRDTLDLAQTGQTLKKRLFRALLGQLHPGRIWNPGDIQGRMNLRRGPEYQTGGTRGKGP